MKTKLANLQNNGEILVAPNTFKICWTCTIALRGEPYWLLVAIIGCLGKFSGHLEPLRGANPGLNYLCKLLCCQLNCIIFFSAQSLSYYEIDMLCWLITNLEKVSWCSDYPSENCSERNIFCSSDWPLNEGITKSIEINSKWN